MKAFEPLNSFEVALKKTQDGYLKVHELMQLLLSFELVVPSVERGVGQIGGFNPLLFDKDGVRMLACFSDKNRAGEFSDKAPCCLMMKGCELLCRMPNNYGFVINPGFPVSFDITPDEISRFFGKLN